ncbi:hypothetical protein E3P92_04181 [Wallemia ichthyophaga]|uniref:Allergen Asp f 7 n=2 Tax=Wallemia ichthyophaga TaxID=245174 RepID=R9A8Z8_WALI9|nr:Allergen Asp f 7 [Wallemia ichthyophaga EXF-994]XP_009266259.1 Allergen Asp f 7 [Wallemia ichthyophaga EXF-994]XP_009270523.1 Allergen Asp f 7 [Wallemia ichthyophaga EXF-994]TIA67683.1 hypothetical protein E3P91_04213 [Wallemia ichthyophaga]EOQ98636.1 Allergen Asp f 7 [Wallemia ichthyophaga EXF-994]EOR04033.1 Allergen Asp f 7 [Wallemia ichthyophaga EXF-994]EOR04042.1 Allergen Asp f 7 [Wallemia ichthyophaga EXF-994]TIA77188.1 hypothetical protein E3P98_04168 [Wallemia ichthyophaga]
MQFTLALATIVAAAASVTAAPLKRSGTATFYYTATGNRGSCGSYLNDSDSIVAVSQADMNQGLCGQQVTIQNLNNGQTATATVQDTCPGCGSGGLDLSPSVFNQLGNAAQGTLPITYWYN